MDIKIKTYDSISAISYLMVIRNSYHGLLKYLTLVSGLQVFRTRTKYDIHIF